VPYFDPDWQYVPPAAQPTANTKEHNAAKSIIGRMGFNQAAVQTPCRAFEGADAGKEPVLGTRAENRCRLHGRLCRSAATPIASRGGPLDPSNAAQTYPFVAQLEPIARMSKFF
jgi:hypothetical protein